MIVAVLIAVIAGALYWLGGVWGIVLLWGLGVLALLPLAVLPVGLSLGVREKIREGRWAGGVMHLLGALLFGAAWLSAVGYVAYRGYLALP